MDKPLTATEVMQRVHEHARIHGPKVIKAAENLSTVLVPPIVRRRLELAAKQEGIDLDEYAKSFGMEIIVKENLI